MRKFAVIIFGIVLTSNAAFAVVQELLIPLPGLIGYYEMTRFEPSLKTSAVLVPSDVTHILNAGIRMVGNASLGTVYCPNDDVFEDLIIEMSMGLVDLTNGISWLNSALFVENGISTEEIGAFVAFGAVEGYIPTLDFLLSGTEEIWVNAKGQMGFPECGWHDSYQTIDVTEVYMVLTVDIPTPVEGNSWSSLKALYR